MMSEHVGMVDRLEVYHIRDGQIIDQRITPPHANRWWMKKLTQLLSWLGIKKWTVDLVTNAGKTTVAQLIGGAFTYVAIGTDDGTLLPLDATNTALGAEADRQVATVTYETTNVTNDTIRLDATFNFTTPTAVQESGVFDAAAGGNMLCRQTFAALNMQAGDQLIMIWKITVQ